MDRWVDGVTGNDTSTGDADHPFKTVLKGIKATRPGDTLTVRPALYREHLGDVRLLGTEAAPVRLVFQPGAVVRPTTLLPEPPTLFEDGIYRLPAPTGFRLIETDEARWRPILVHDPNGVHFHLEKPVPTHPVKSLEQVREVPGSSWYDAVGQQVLFRPYGSIDHGLEAISSKTCSWRSTHTTVEGFQYEYGAVCQLYGAVSMTFIDLSSRGACLQLLGTRDCAIVGAFVEQVITRGEGFLWYDKGAGQGMQVNETCQRTTVMNVTVRHGWNGVSWNGTQTRVDGAVCYGFPNHNFGIGGTDNTYRRVKAYQAQEGLFAHTGTRCVVEDCEIERAIVLGSGHTLTGRAFTNFVFRRNTILGSGMINASDDSTLLLSDQNYWITTVFDWRYQNQRLTSLDAIRAVGFERHSVWDNRMLPR